MTDTDKPQKTFTPRNRRNDWEKRKRQAARIVRIIRVHCLVRKYGNSKDDTAMIAEILGVSYHTVMNDKKLLKTVYELIGSKNLDSLPQPSKAD